MIDELLDTLEEGKRIVFVMGRSSNK